MLNFAHPDDLVIFLNAQQKPGTAPKPAVN